MCKSHLEDFIQSMYKDIRIYNPKELNPSSISKRLGVKLFYWKDKTQVLFIRNATFIFINANLSPAAQWQDFCHELCHVVFHIGNQKFMNPMFREYQEWKANNFMYHACVHTFMLDSLEIKDMTTYNIHKIQTLFNVEYEFAQQRLNQYITNKLSSLKWNGVL